MELNADVYAGDILRYHYRQQMDEHARLAREAARLRDDLERVEADQQTAADRATSIMETLARYGGMLAPEDIASAGEARSDATTQIGAAEGEHAVVATSDETPKGGTRPAHRGGE